MCLLPAVFHVRCGRTDLRRRQPIWLQQVGCLAHSNSQMTMWERQIIMLEIHWAKALNLGNRGTNIIHHRCIVTCLRNHHIQLLSSSTTLPHSTWHQAHNQALVEPRDIWVRGFHGKPLISPKEVTVDLKCSPHSNSQDMGHHLQMHLGGIQHCLETIHWFGRRLPPLPQQDNHPAHLPNPPLASHPDYFRLQRNRPGQLFQGLPICPQHQSFPMTNIMESMKMMIGQTLVVRKTKPQSAWSERISPCSNLPKGWGSPTLVPSTRGRRDGSLGFWRRSIGQSGGDRTVWTSCEIDPWTGRWRLQIVWWHLRTGYLWYFWYCLMDSVTLGSDIFKEMCKWGSAGKEVGKARQQAAGDGFGSTYGQKARDNLPE